MTTKLENRPQPHGRILATAALALALPAVLIAAGFTELDVGMAGNSATTRSATVGTNNSADNDSAAIGASYSATHKAVSLGNNNSASYSSVAAGGYNAVWNFAFAAGNSNIAWNLSAAIGYLNDVNTVSHADPADDPRHAAAIGLLNFVVGNNALAAGSENLLQADNAAVLGRGLTSTAADATVVGSYNADRADLRFAVGNGTGPAANERSNALEVYANGDIIMKKQGDISMGEFQ